MNKHKIFIKECYEGKHGSICQEWKDTILKHYPEFEEEQFKAGDWVVRLTDCHAGLCVGDITRVVAKKEGFKNNYILESSPSDYSHKAENLRKATPKEIESHLIEEAKKRGFVKGVEIKCHMDELDKPRHIGTSCLKIDFETYRYYDTEDVLQIDAAVVYSKGQWAEIVETITKEEAERQLGKKIV